MNGSETITSDVTSGCGTVTGTQLPVMLVTKVAQSPAKFLIKINALVVNIGGLCK